MGLDDLEGMRLGLQRRVGALWSQHLPDLGRGQIRGTAGLTPSEGLVDSVCRL